MPMYNLIKYSDNFLKHLVVYINTIDLNHFQIIMMLLLIFIFLLIIITVLRLNVKQKKACRTEIDGTKNFKTRVPLKYLSNFWITLEMPLTNQEINLILTWSNRCFIIDKSIADQGPTFTITDTKVYVSIVILSTQDDAKLLQQL